MIERKPSQPINLKEIQQNIESEPISSSDRKAWLEVVAEKNRLKSLSTKGIPKRVTRARSLCNLTSLGVDIDDARMEDILGLNDIKRQVSTDDISQSIDKENRGKAFSLPSVIKRKSLNLGQLEKEGETFSSLKSRDNDDKLEKSSEEDDKEEEEDEDVFECPEIIDIQERMKLFERNNPNSSVQMRKPNRTINRTKRPKSYAGEDLTSFETDEKYLNEKEKDFLRNRENPQDAIALGRTLLSNNTNSSADREKRLSRRRSFASHRILAEIAEMESREAEFNEEREKLKSSTFSMRVSTKKQQKTKKFGNDKTISKGEEDEEEEQFSSEKKSYPKGLKKFLDEYEKK